MVLDSRQVGSAGKCASQVRRERRTLAGGVPHGAICRGAGSRTPEIKTCLFSTCPMSGRSSNGGGRKVPEPALWTTRLSQAQRSSPSATAHPGLGLPPDPRATAGLKLGPVVTSCLLPRTGQWARGLAEAVVGRAPSPAFLPVCHSCHSCLSSLRESVPLPSVSSLSFRLVTGPCLCPVCFTWTGEAGGSEIEGVPDDLAPPLPRCRGDGGPRSAFPSPSPLLKTVQGWQIPS